MTKDELLTDLNDRLERGIETLLSEAEDSDRADVKLRLLGKRQGLQVVQDWLRSY